MALLRDTQGRSPTRIVLPASAVAVPLASPSPAALRTPGVPTDRRRVLPPRLNASCRFAPAVAELDAWTNEGRGDPVAIRHCDASPLCRPTAKTLSRIGLHTFGGPSCPGWTGDGDNSAASSPKSKRRPLRRPADRGISHAPGHNRG